MLHLLFSWSVHAVANIWTLGLIASLPVVLIEQSLVHRRDDGSRATVLVALIIGAGYLVGGTIGWSLSPARWKMTFGETFKASFNAEKDGHVTESQAERVLMYSWHMAVLCSIATALAAGLILRFRHRAAA